MATGLQAPGRPLVHRQHLIQVGAVLVEETWCGIKRPASWNQLEEATPDCTRCARVWARHLAEQEPFAPGERVLYTKTRHPGLMHFLPAYTGGNKPVGWGWRVIGAPRTHWSATQDMRAPAGRPIQLGMGGLSGEPVAYHTSVLAAIEWTKNLVRTGDILTLYRALHAGTWDPQAEHFPLSDTASGTLKETNPA